MSETATLTANPASSAANVLGALTPQQHADWRLTGSLPAVEPTAPASESDVTPESSPATPVDRAAEVAASSPPASKPGTPSKKPSNAESRKADLNAEILALKAERDRLRADRDALLRPSPAPAVNPVSPPDPAPADLATVLARPDISQTPLTEAAFWERFPEATVGDYARYVARYELVADREQMRVQSSRQQKAQAFTEQIGASPAERAAFWQTQDPRFTSPAFTPIDLLPPQTPIAASHVIAQELVTSPSAKLLIEYLTAHPDELTALEASATTADIIRSIGRLEARLSRPSTTVPPAAPAALPVSLAPPPPATLGQKPSQPADELQEAIRTGDFARYRELQNRQEMRSA